MTQNKKEKLKTILEIKKVMPRIAESVCQKPSKYSKKKLLFPKFEFW
jgi:hypothetical protein